MRILVACEESQIVCQEFRLRGHEAYSCDIIECSGEHPEWHIKSDVLPHLKDACMCCAVKDIGADFNMEGYVKPVKCKDCRFFASYEKPVEDFDGRCFVRECETDEEEYCSYGVAIVNNRNC